LKMILKGNENGIIIQYYVSLL